MNSVPKELRQIAKEARKAGWLLYRNGSGHIEWRGPYGRKARTPVRIKSPSAERNYLSQLRRAGVPGA